MYYIRTKAELLEVKKIIPDEVYTNLYELVSILEIEYKGNQGNDYGGIILLDDKLKYGELVKCAMKKFVALDGMPFEWQNSVKNFLVTLFIPSDEWNIVVVSKK